MLVGRSPRTLMILFNVYHPQLINNVGTNSPYHNYQSLFFLYGASTNYAQWPCLHKIRMRDRLRYTTLYSLEQQHNTKWWNSWLHHKRPPRARQQPYTTNPEYGIVDSVSWAGRPPRHLSLCVRLLNIVVRLSMLTTLTDTAIESIGGPKPIRSGGNGYMAIVRRFRGWCWTDEVTLVCIIIYKAYRPVRLQSQGLLGSFMNKDGLWKRWHKAFRGHWAVSSQRT